MNLISGSKSHSLPLLLRMYKVIDFPLVVN